MKKLNLKNENGKIRLVNIYDSVFSQARDDLFIELTDAKPKAENVYSKKLALVDKMAYFYVTASLSQKTKKVNYTMSLNCDGIYRSVYFKMDVKNTDNLYIQKRLLEAENALFLAVSNGDVKVAYNNLLQNIKSHIFNRSTINNYLTIEDVKINGLKYNFWLTNRIDISRYCEVWDYNFKNWEVDIVQFLSDRMAA